MMTAALVTKNLKPSRLLKDSIVFYQWWVVWDPSSIFRTPASSMLYFMCYP